MCGNLSQDLETIQRQHAARFQQIQEEGNSIAADGQRLEQDSEMRGVVFDFDVDMIEQRWVFHLPSVTMRENNIALHLPQVTMRQQNIVFHTPSVRMSPRVVGRIPHFRCEGFPPRCETWWEDIITHVPETFMEEQRIVLGIPEVRVDRSDIRFHLPEFRMEEQVWLVRIPEFRLRSIQTVSEDGRRLQQRGDALRDAGQRQGQRLRQDLGQRVSAQFACERGNLLQTRTQADQQFRTGLAQMDGAIAQLRSQNISPEAVQTSGGPMNLVQRRAELAERHAQAMQQIDQALTQLNQREQEALTQIGGG
jgi:hypothetical protein